MTTRLAQHLDSLSTSADSLRARSFSGTRSFQNTLLARVSITQLIRDAEPHESALFTTRAERRERESVPDSGAAGVLKQRDASLPVLLETLERVMRLYPSAVSSSSSSSTTTITSTTDGSRGDAEGMRERVEMMRHKGRVLERNIADLEGQVDAQRRRLDEMSSGRAAGIYTQGVDDDDDDDDDDNQRREQVEGGGGGEEGQERIEEVVVTEEMIRAEEEEITRLEQLIESKSRR